MTISNASTLTLCSTGLVLAWWFSGWLKERRNNPNGLPLPPGPKAYPVIGNFLDFPTFKPWLAFDQWSQTYVIKGDVVYFKVFGQPFIVLGSLESTWDLFEKRSSNYSDRGRMPMLNEIIGMTWNMTFLPYGAWWRRHRRMFHEFFHPNIVHEYHELQVNTTRAFLRRLLKSPDDFTLHARHAFNSTILRIAYGMTISDEDESYVKVAETVLGCISKVVNPGSFLVNSFPIMKYIPAWIPGAGWKKKAIYWRGFSDIFANSPWLFVKKQLTEGTAEPCIATALIDKLPDKGSPDYDIEDELSRNVCAVSFTGGAITSVSTVQSFFMALALYPEVQKKAQQELDNVLGGRLPEFGDRPNLPYINAMVKESMRWHVVAPLSVPHKASEADEYCGYYIPKGTIIIGNAWSILHDPSIYEDPLEYKPERFLKDGKLDPTVRDPTVAGFYGFGRRICPGRYFADNSMFICMAHLLSVYDIRPALDKDGKEIPIKPGMTDGVLSYPEPFTCRIIPRSKKTVELIRNSGLAD
ncbi:hypothetical protein NP233_g2460 [Leucocoprinus birnbaumii]|uniref:Cytochrome P450 n=1 Tax=Leucocoprinus birnbaumii TaxID=56174 RepID=A0AAD5W282_9AGAR|nr:hypothetical protein NP233_g2460 [Leucocoprinus birnbaumii]